MLQFLVLFGHSSFAQVNERKGLNELQKSDDFKKRREESNLQREQAYASTKKAREEHIEPVAHTRLELIIATVKDNYEAGEPIVLEVSLKNVGEKAVSLSYQEVQNFYNIEVLEPSLTPAYELKSRFTAYYQRDLREPSYVRLAPGQIRKATARLNGMYDMTESGTYTIKVSKRLSDVGNQGKVSVLESNALKLKVTNIYPLTEWQEYSTLFEPSRLPPREESHAPLMRQSPTPVDN